MKECVSKYFSTNGKIESQENFEKVYPYNEKKIIYEVIRVINGYPLFLEEHMNRMDNSVVISKTNYKHSSTEIESDIKKVIEKCNIVNGNIKVVLWQGGSMVFEINHSYPSIDMYNEGVPTILYFGERENPNAKIINNDFRGKVNKEIAKNNVFEAILVNNDGNITEGSKSNIFMVKDGVVYTAPVKGVLPGITRDKIIEACRMINVQVKEEDISYKEVENLDGLFISGTSPKVLPIKKIGEKEFFSSKNEIIEGISAAYDEIIDRDIEKVKNNWAINN